MSVSSKLSIIAPQFDVDSRRSEIIAFAELQVNATWFDAKYEWAAAYLAAHYLALNPASGGSTEPGGGFIVSKREGDLSVTYAKPAVSGTNLSDDSLSQTSFGQQFIQLRNSSNFILGVTGQNENVS